MHSGVEHDETPHPLGREAPDLEGDPASHRVADDVCLPLDEFQRRAGHRGQVVELGEIGDREIGDVIEGIGLGPPHEVVAQQAGKGEDLGSRQAHTSPATSTTRRNLAH